MIHIVHELRKARGTNAKMRILNTYEHDVEWKQTLVAMYDSSVNYFVSAPKDATFTNYRASVDMLDALNRLSRKVYTGNAARQYALECSQVFGEMFRLVLGGSLKAGVSITSINKAYPGLIPTFPVMLAKEVENLRYPLLASTKYDGVRVIAFVTENSVVLKTRAGKLLPISSLEYALHRAKPGVYDGELVSGDGLQAGRTVITGQVNKCLKGTATDMDDYTFAVFDYIPLEAWQRKQCTWVYQQRLDFLNQLYGPNVIIAEQLWVDNDEQVEGMYEDHIERGYEGLILRSAEDPYLWERTPTLIKKKATNDCVLGVYDTVDGTGKYEGMIGSLMCSGMVKGKEVRVKVGSGLSDHDREQDRSHYIGAAVEVLYNDITRAKGSTQYSLFLPRFKRVLGDHNV